MRIILDLQGCQGGSRFRGIGRYSLDFCQEFVRQGVKKHEIFIVLNGMLGDTIEPLRDAFHLLLPQDHIHVWHGFEPAAMLDRTNDKRRLASEAVREAFLASLEPDLIILTSPFEGAGDNAVGSVETLFSIPTAAILYDLIPLIHADNYLNSPEARHWYFSKLRDLKKADILFSISESSRQEAIKYLKFDQSNICNISAACSDFFMAEDSSISEINIVRFGIKKPFILYVSASDKRKNHDGLLAAYSLLPKHIRDKHQLVLGGSFAEEHRQQILENIKGKGMAGEVILTGHVSDAEMRSLYNQCKAFVMPSWHEGFGLPALEAMRCGKATIASNCSSLPEVIGRDDALFNPYDPAEMASKIEKVLSDDIFRGSLEEYSLNRSQEFSWERSANKALDFLDVWFDCNPRSRIHWDGEKFEKLIRYFGKTGLLDYFDEMHLAATLAENFRPKRQRKQLFVDISELVYRDAGTGIQRVVRSILGEWLANPPTGWTIEPVYATLEREGYFYARQFEGRFLGLKHTEANDDPVDARPGDVFLGLDLQSNIVPAQKTVLQKWREHGVMINFVVYDLLPILRPDCFPEEAEFAHAKWLRTVLEFDRAICISDTVANELLAWLSQEKRASKRPLAIDSFHLGADIENCISSFGFPAEASDVLKAIESCSVSFLMVGTIEPRKGHQDILDAMDELWRNDEDVCLVLVGKQGWLVEDFVQKVRNCDQLNKKLFWLEGISDEYLHTVYASCTCLIAASEAEGFGLPLIEAARHGLPIVARDIEVFREVAGSNASYFDANCSPEKISMFLLDWVKAYRAGKHVCSQELTWNSWSESAETLFEKATQKSETARFWS